MKFAHEILQEVFEPTPQDCQTPLQDLQLAITLNPDIPKIIESMHLFAAQFKNWISVYEKLPPNKLEVIGYDSITKEQYHVVYLHESKTWYSTRKYIKGLKITHFHYKLQNPE
jgi:hypothetical protein